MSSAVNSGGSRAAVGTDGNLLSVENSTSTRFIVDAEGDLFADAGTTTTAVTVYDHLDDVYLLRALAHAVAPRTVIKTKWDTFVKYSEEDLVEAGILGAPLKDKPLYSVTGLQMLHNGAIWQMHVRQQELVHEVGNYKRLIENLERRQDRYENTPVPVRSAISLAACVGC